MIQKSEEKIIGLFREVKLLTHNFKEFDVDVFRKNPERIVILRLILNKSQVEFARFVNRGKSTVSMWENGHSKPKCSTLKNIFRKIKDEIENQNIMISEHSIKTHFLLFKKVWLGAFNDREFAKRMSHLIMMKLPPGSRERALIQSLKNSKRTEDEIKISKILEEYDIPFEEQVPIIKPLQTKAGMAIVDFLVTLNGRKIVIETSKIKTQNIKRFKKRARRHACLLAHKAFRMKRFFPNITLIAAIRTDLDVNSKPMEIIKEAFDHVVVNDFEVLPSLIKSNNAESGNFRA